MTEREKNIAITLLVIALTTMACICINQRDKIRSLSENIERYKAIGSYCGEEVMHRIEKGSTDGFCGRLEFVNGMIVGMKEVKRKPEFDVKSYLKCANRLLGTPPENKQSLALFHEWEGVEYEVKEATKQLADLFNGAALDLAELNTCERLTEDIGNWLVDVVREAESLKRTMISANLPKQYLEDLNGIIAVAGCMVRMEKEPCEVECKLPSRYTYWDFENFSVRIHSPDDPKNSLYTYELDRHGNWMESPFGNTVDSMLTEAANTVDRLVEAKDKSRESHRRIERTRTLIKLLITRMKRGSLPQIFIDGAKRLLDLTHDNVLNGNGGK